MQFKMTRKILTLLAIMSDLVTISYNFNLPIKEDCLPEDDPTGVNYAGTKSTTRYGGTCKYWTNATEDKNYCRNRHADSFLPWCYTTEFIYENWNASWDYCDIPKCYNKMHVKESCPNHYAVEGTNLWGGKYGKGYGSLRSFHFKYDYQHCIESCLKNPKCNQISYHSHRYTACFDYNSLPRKTTSDFKVLSVSLYCASRQGCPPGKKINVAYPPPSFVVSLLGEDVDIKLMKTLERCALYCMRKPTCGHFAYQPKRQICLLGGLTLELSKPSESSLDKTPAGEILGLLYCDYD